MWQGRLERTQLEQLNARAGRMRAGVQGGHNPSWSPYSMLVENRRMTPPTVAVTQA